MASLRNADGRQVRTGGTSRHRVVLGQALTPLESRVAQRMVQLDEPTRRRAARDLEMSEDALRQHMQRIYRKLGVSTLLGMFRALTEGQPMYAKRCLHCSEPIKTAPGYAPHPWVHVGTGTWWCAPRTRATPVPDETSDTSSTQG